MIDNQKKLKTLIDNHIDELIAWDRNKWVSKEQKDKIREWINQKSVDAVNTQSFNE